jgi:polar amino acid transport system substrate-binding protein
MRLIFCWVTAVSFPLWANESDPLNKTLRLAVIYIEEPPYIYLDDGSEYIGILPKLAQALSRELALDLTYLPTPRKGLEQSLINDQADMTWLSPDWVVKGELLLFSDPVLLHREFLYSLSPFKENEKPVDWLKDKTVCIRQDYDYPSLSPFFEKGLAEAVRVSSQVSLVKLLQKGRCDVLYMNENKATWMMSHLGINNKIWRSEYPVNEAKLSFVFSQKWQSKMTQINQALAKIKDSGELNAIVQSNTHPAILSQLLVD